MRLLTKEEDDSMRIRITNVLLTPGVTNETHIPFIPDAEVLVDGSRIAYAGPRSEAPAFDPEQGCYSPA